MTKGPDADHPGEPPATRTQLLDSEAALTAAASETARSWAGLGLAPLVVAFHGDLGSGKTTFIRAMLRGLGYTGRVPSPTYTLVEHYPLATHDLTVVHLDLYRLADEGELDHLGLRDWLAEPRVWLLVEWPERSAGLRAVADLELRLEMIAAGTSRQLAARARTAKGLAALKALAEPYSR